MKIRSYKILFRIFSCLADKTNGTQLFVKYKLMLGTLIIGLAVSSAGCKSKKGDVMCYVIVPEPEPQIMCYEPVVPPGMSDSLEIRGRVVDIDKEPLAGVSVYIKKSHQLMVFTDKDGNFTIKVKADDILMFTAVSQPIYIPVSKLKKTEINEIVFGVK